MQHEENGVHRRDLLKLGGYAALGALLFPSFSSEAMATAFNNGVVKGGARDVTFRNSHTGEVFSGAYRVGNKYLPDAFDQINYVLRDFRTGDVFPIDPRLMDIIYTVHQMTGAREPYEVISGYRSPKTNTMLRKASSGVAKNSLHMSGQAIDVRIPNFDTTRIRDVAVSLQAGGVGYYRRSNFVHMDTGDVRAW